MEFAPETRRQSQIHRGMQRLIPGQHRHTHAREQLAHPCLER
ncbi:hypothetical protein [Streptomyces sp. NBC_01538]